MEILRLPRIVKGGEHMRAFYTDITGLTADLCLFLNRTHTRLTVRSGYQTIHCQVYASWDAAINALRTMGAGWTNDITHEAL